VLETSIDCRPALAYAVVVDGGGASWDDDGFYVVRFAVTVVLSVPPGGCHRMVLAYVAAR